MVFRRQTRSLQRFLALMLLASLLFIACCAGDPATVTGSEPFARKVAAAAEVTFPKDAGVINVKTQYGAKGDGITDDTAAIQAALNAHPNAMRIIYLPRGIYLVSDTLTWPAGTRGGDDYKNVILQGQSEQATIIKLKDRSPGFTDVNKLKAVIFTGPAPAQRFGNSIRTLTVHTGVGNPGACGIQFNASNQGSLRQVTIRSGDGQGVNGLDMNFTDEIGPLLVKEVTVQGFQYGIRTGFNVNSQTFEHVLLENQQIYGFYNTGQVINVRGLTSRNVVPAIYNGGGRFTLVDSSLQGTGEAANLPAIKSAYADVMVRNVKTSGYRVALQVSETTTLPGPDITEFVGGDLIISQFPSPSRSLNLPIRETPEIPWDNPDKTPWANVAAYGAVPNDGQDDTAAIQAAIDSGRTTVYFPAGGYNLQGTVLVRNQVRRLIGTEAYVEVPKTVNPGFKIVDGKAPVVVFERIRSWYFGTPTVENASSRTFVVRDATDVALKLTGPGDIYIENLATSALTINGQRVWARQLNIENLGTKIINNGGQLWILGLKTERGGTLIDTRRGGTTELLGGFAYTTTAAADGQQNEPMLINHESNISVTLGEINFGGGPPYTIYVRETRNGITRDLLAEKVPIYVGGGRHIPLYVGYSGSQGK